MFHALGSSEVQSSKTLETFPTPLGVHRIELDCDEFTSVCPENGQPDMAIVTIVIVPDQFCVESKSLKLYLQSFRNVGLFAEEAASVICDDVMKAAKPIWCEVIVKQKRRGGIAITASARKVRS